MAAPTVPDLLYGCWRRSWIEYSDGNVDDTTQVWWLQLESLMVDVRIGADAAALSNRSGLSECSLDDLRTLAANDASSGFTECGPPTVGPDGRMLATATWNTRGHGVNLQPVSAFPEPGLMEWSADGTVMIERAPSGAYVEEWQLVPGSRQPLSVRRADGMGTVYRTGDVAVLVRDRATPVPRRARLLDLFDDYVDQRTVVEAILDCEFSVAERNEGEWVIVASTLPWRKGDKLDVAG